MKLATLVEKYIAFMRAKGMRYRTQSVILRHFSRLVGPVAVTQVRLEAVDAFLYRSKTVTSSWHQNYSILKGLYHYAITREHVKFSPLPLTRPKGPSYAQPYIYSAEEIKALLDSSKILDSESGHRLGAFSVTAFRTLLLLLYGAGLRSSEALS